MSEVPDDQLADGWEFPSPKMKTCFTHKVSDWRIAIADLTDYYSLGFLITRINVPMHARGQRIGSKLLREILMEADKRGVALFLEIAPSDGLDFDELLTWYTRYGFRRWDGIYRRVANTPYPLESMP